MSAQRNAKISPDDALDVRVIAKGGRKAQRGFFQIAGLIAALVLSGSLAYAFIIAPQSRAAAREAKHEQAAAERTSPGAAHPSEAIRAAPAAYDRLPTEDAQPTSQRAIDGPEEVVNTGHSRATHSSPEVVRPSPAEEEALEAIRSPLLFAQAQRPPARAAPPSEQVRVPRTEDYAAVTLDRAPLRELSPNRLAAGTIVPAALETAIDTDLAGLIAARVTANVYDTTTGDILLIPQGARLLGRYDRDVAYGQHRALLVWERILFPDGSSLSLGAMPGVDAAGTAGVRDQVDYHGGRLLGAIGLGAMISTIGEIARNDTRDERSFTQNVGDAAAAEAARVSGRLVEREMQVRPTIRIRAGAPVRVTLTKDVIFDPVSGGAR